MRDKQVALFRDKQITLFEGQIGIKRVILYRPRQWAFLCNSLCSWQDAGTLKMLVHPASIWDQCYCTELVMLDFYRLLTDRFSFKLYYEVTEVLGIHYCVLSDNILWPIFDKTSH